MGLHASHGVNTVIHFHTLQDEKCSIDNKTYFSTTDELLLYYHENCLPNKTVKLAKAYLLDSAGYVNERYVAVTVLVTNSTIVRF